MRSRFRLAADYVPGAGINLDHRQALVLSLALFSGLFALQSSLNIAFLWSGKVLPDGLNYVEFARAGAYPLLFICLFTVVYLLIIFGNIIKPIR